MFRFNRRILYAVLGFLVPLFILAVFLPVIRQPVLIILRSPLYLCQALGRELNGIIFYHRNYADRDRLLKRNDFLENRLARMNDIFAENTRLSNLLTLKSHSSYKVLAARVIGKDPSNWSSTVIIDKGVFHGIRKGAACVSFLGLVGRVTETGRYASKILLLNDPNVNVSARLQRSRQEGLVCGSLGGSLILKLLPKDCDVVAGDTVVTSGLTTVYPKDLLIGTVSAVSKDFSGLNQYAVVKPAVDLSSLEEVLIVVE